MYFIKKIKEMFSEALEVVEINGDFVVFFPKGSQQAIDLSNDMMALWGNTNCTTHKDTIRVTIYNNRIEGLSKLWDAQKSVNKSL